MGVRRITRHRTQIILIKTLKKGGQPQAGLFMWVMVATVVGIKWKMEDVLSHHHGPYTRMTSVDTMTSQDGSHPMTSLAGLLFRK